MVSALWIAIMKEDLTRDEFYKIVREQAKVFRTGKVFDKTWSAPPESRSKIRHHGCSVKEESLSE